MTSADLLRNVEQLMFWLRQSLQQKRELWPTGYIRMPTRIDITNIYYINNVQYFVTAHQQCIISRYISLGQPGGGGRRHPVITLCIT